MTAAGPPGPVVRSNRAMNVIAALLESRTGQQIDASRAWRIETALKPVLRARGIETLDGLVTRIHDGRAPALARSEERRGREEGVSTCKYRWSLVTENKQTTPTSSHRPK